MALKLKLFICLLFGATFAFPEERVYGNEEPLLETDLPDDDEIPADRKRSEDFVDMPARTHGGVLNDQIKRKEPEPNRLRGENAIPACRGAVVKGVFADEGSKNKRNAIADPAMRWTDATIPYTVSNDPKPFTEEQLEIKRQAMALWAKHTCLKFREATDDDANYIELHNTECAALVGMQGGAQPVNVGCSGVQLALHELGHAIGLEHEHQRPDRDDFITVKMENVEEGENMVEQFEKLTTDQVNTYDTLYDYLSIMQYAGLLFAKGDEPVIVTKDPYFQRILQEGQTPSFRDYRIVNMMYSCNADCDEKTCPGEGFVGTDCECWCPGNPILPCGSPYEEMEALKCQDKGDGCEAKAENEECDSDPEIETCLLSCKLCNPDCVDTDGNCDYFANTGSCESNKEEMETKCPKSCRFCNPMNV